MPYYLVATHQHNRYIVKPIGQMDPTLQLTTEPCQAFHFHDCENIGPFDTVEQVEAEVSKRLPAGWRHLYPTVHHIRGALKAYTAEPVRPGTGVELVREMRTYTLDASRRVAKLPEDQQENWIEDIHRQHWNDGVDFDRAMIRRIAFIGATLADNGLPIQFEDRFAMAAANRAVKDRRLRARMIHLSLTPTAYHHYYKFMAKLVDVLIDAGLIVLESDDLTRTVIAQWEVSK